MADKKIVDLLPLSTQSPTDIYEVSINGAGSFKESRSFMLDYINQNAQLQQSQIVNLISDLSSKLSLSGGVMTGNLTLNADPTNSLQAATKQYVDSSITSSSNFQNVYNNSGASPSFTVNAGGFSIKDSSTNTLYGISSTTTDLKAQNFINLTTISNGKYTQFKDSGMVNYVPSDVGVNNPNFTFSFFSDTPHTTAETIGNFQTGFCDESSSPSGFFKINIKSNNVINNIFYATGIESGNMARVGLGGQLTLGINYGSSSNQNALLQMNSTTQGFLPPVLNSAQESTLTSLLGSSDVGLHWYNSTDKIPTYWDGIAKQQLLVIDNIIQGSNMSITNNGDGTVTFSSSGGGSTSTQIQGSFYSSSTSVLTNVGVTDVPIAVNPSSFNAVNAVGTNVTTATVSGVTTAIIQNNSVGGRWCTINYDLTMYIPASSGQVYSFTVYTNTGYVLFFKRFTLSGSAPLYKEFSLSTPVVFINTNDYVYLAVSSNVPSGASFNAYYFSGRLVDTTIAGLTGTSELPQSGNNWYLTQNGGSTLSSATGTITSGNLAQFSGTSGLVEDSGISVNDLVLLTDNQTISGTKTFSNIIMGDLGGVASSANTINTAMQYADLDYYVGFYPSQINGYQQTRITSTSQSNPLRYNPVTGALKSVSFVGSLTGNADTVTDGVVTSGSYADPSWITALSASKLTGAFSGYSGGNAALTGTNSALTFGSSLSNGNYLQFPGGNNIGQFNFGGFPNLFSTYNATYDATASSYKYVNTGQNAFVLEFAPTGIYWKYAGSGIAGDPITLSTGVHLNNAGIVNIQSLGVSSMVVTDGSKNLVSAPLPFGINAIVTSNSSTQAMSWETCYIVTYDGGQMVGSLPAATGSGKIIRIIGLSGASTAGWHVTADGTDLIQFGISISSSGGSISSTVGSATDCIELLDAAAGIIVVCSAVGLDLVVA